MTPSPIPLKERSGEQSVDRCKDTSATQQSGEKDRGRDKARKRLRASGGSSSSGARSRAGSSRGSGSLSASGLSGLSSGSRSSSSSSSPGSPRPWRPRDDRRRSGSKPKPPGQDEKERRRRSPAPKPTKVHVARLTRKVSKRSSIPPHKTRPDSPVPTLQGPCGQSSKRRGSLRFLPPLEVRPSSFATSPAESRKAPPSPQDHSPIRGI